MTGPTIKDVPCGACQHGYNLTPHTCDYPDHCPCDRSFAHFVPPNLIKASGVERPFAPVEAEPKPLRRIGRRTWIELAEVVGVRVIGEGGQARVAKVRLKSGAEETYQIPIKRTYYQSSDVIEPQVTAWLAEHFGLLLDVDTDARLDGAES